MLALEKELQRPERRLRNWSPANVESFRKGRSRFTLPETATYGTALNTSARQYLTVFPDQDLFILRPQPNIDVLDWDFIWDSFPSYESSPFSPTGIHEDSHDWMQMSSPRPWCERQMALEYDPA